jgi:DNA polymerase I-like protein with 3'-5' exonuclease and polymerase domains
MLVVQELADSKSRVHCSLNLNTETGRLSSRRPNLQNQPALEKVKSAFIRASEIDCNSCGKCFHLPICV